MSADNGIYILDLKDQSRVIHAQAIDNLWWSYIDNDTVDQMVLPRVVEYFGNCEPLDKEQSRVRAEELADDTSILEYGINIFSIDQTWNSVCEESQKIAMKELEYILAIPNFQRSFYLSELEALLEVAYGWYKENEDVIF